MKRFALTVLVLLTAWFNTAQAAVFSSYPSEDYPTLSAIAVNGPIVHGDVDAFINLVRQHNQAGRTVSLVLLNSPGGNVGEGVRFARAVYAMGAGTIVGSYDECDSICVLIFAAGSPRMVFSGGSLGVHNASLDGIDSPGASLMLGSFMNELGVPYPVIQKMIGTTSSSISYLTETDVAGWLDILPEVKAPAVRTATVAPPPPPKKVVVAEKPAKTKKKSKKKKYKMVGNMMLPDN